jgi:uncharacterized membrane protein YbhN (UPF0104 family)
VVLKFFIWFINTGLLSNGLLLVLAINTTVILVSILKDGYCKAVESHKWIAWMELVMMIGVMVLAVNRIIERGR